MYLGRKCSLQNYSLAEVNVPWRYLLRHGNWDPPECPSPRDLHVLHVFRFSALTWMCYVCKCVFLGVRDQRVHSLAIMSPNTCLCVDGNCLVSQLIYMQADL